MGRLRVKSIEFVIPNLRGVETDIFLPLLKVIGPIVESCDFLRHLKFPLKFLLIRLTSGSLSIRVGTPTRKSNATARCEKAGVNEEKLKSKQQPIPILWNR